jgi:hypothetical protein
MSHMNHSHNSNQCIHCDVTSCQYNAQNGICGLEAITVAPCPGCGSGNKSEESMCASYEAKA